MQKKRGSFAAAEGNEMFSVDGKTIHVFLDGKKMIRADGEKDERYGEPSEGEGQKLNTSRHDGVDDFQHSERNFPEQLARRRR